MICAAFQTGLLRVPNRRFGGDLRSIKGVDMPAPLAALALPALTAFLFQAIILPLSFWFLFTMITRIASYLIFHSDTISGMLGSISSNVFTFSEALQLLPAFTAQLFFFMHLDQCFAMLGATIATLVVFKVFGRFLPF